MKLQQQVDSSAHAACDSQPVVVLTHYKYGGHAYTHPIEIHKNTPWLAGKSTICGSSHA